MKHKKWRYVIFKLVDKEKIEVEKCGPRETDYSCFLTSVPVNEPRWIIYDLEYEETDL